MSERVPADQIEQIVGASRHPFRHIARECVAHEACGSDREVTTCGSCAGMWCDACDPAHGPLCPWCHGQGYSTAAIRLPLYRQANHLRDNNGHPVQEM